MADPNLYLRGDGILLHLYVDDISILNMEDATKAVIEVETMISETYTITNLGPARQSVCIKIHCEQTGSGSNISLSQMVIFSTILERFNMPNGQDGATPMDSDVKLDLAKDQEENELHDIKGYQAIVGSLR